jgi:hypothetical protein
MICMKLSDLCVLCHFARERDMKSAEVRENLVNEIPHGSLKRLGYGEGPSTYAVENHSAVRTPS